jgi:outer membrane lipoprotein SlyB
MKIHSITKLASSMIVMTLLGACSPQDGSPTADANLSAAPTEPARIAAEQPGVAPAPVICGSCGVIRSITAVSQEGRATGVGAVVGGIVGGLAGNQVGGGTGKKIATVAGVIGGAVVGNEIEQNRSSANYYEVVIDMETGGQQFITVADATGISPGSAVTVQGSNISLR